MVFRWDGLLVCLADNDIRNPQDIPVYNHNQPSFSSEGSGEISVLEDVSFADLGDLTSQDDDYIYDQDGEPIYVQGD